MRLRPSPVRFSLPLRQGLVLVLSLTCLATPSHAQWKWRDAQGRVQYSDRAPPPNVPDRDVLQRPGGQSGPLVLLPMGTAASPAPAGVATAASGSAAGAEAAARKRQSADADEAKRRVDETQQRQRAQEAQQKARTENCQSARDQIKLIQDGVRLARINAQGEREILDDAGRNRELERARALQASDCR
jgi:hypothetical protein